MDYHVSSTTLFPRKKKVSTTHNDLNSTFSFVACFLKQIQNMGSKQSSFTSTSLVEKIQSKQNYL